MLSVTADSILLAVLQNIGTASKVDDDDADDLFVCVFPRGQVHSLHDVICVSGC